MSSTLGESDARSAGQRGRILVVDDDASMAAAMCAILEDDGFTVEVIGDGLLAIKGAALRRPDLVVLDITLPGASGPEVAMRLREQYGRALPIVAVTADGHAARKALEVGAVAYLRKPFDLDDFVEMIHRVLL